MEISKESLSRAASHLGISKGQIEALWDSLEKEQASPKISSFSKVLFYFGALMIILAMSWFLNLNWEWFGGLGIFLVSIAYAIIFTLMGAKFWKNRELKIPAGLFITIAVCMTPLAIYGLQIYFNLWPKDVDLFSSDRKVVFMELGTIIAGLVALKFFPFPFITAPIYFAIWFLTMDTLPELIGKESSFEYKQWLSMIFGFITIIIAYLFDRKQKNDYSFWGYFFGALTFWISLTTIAWGKGELVLALYFIINIVMVIVSIVLKRNIFIILGAIGIFTYFSHLAYELFKDSVFFPFALSLMGLLIVYLGILTQKNIGRIEQTINKWMQKLFHN